MKILNALLKAGASGINHGRSGNGSVRHPGGMRITPTAAVYEELTDTDLVFVPDSGTPTGLPSSEWQMHQAVYQARPDVHAVLHLHSPAATALACLRQDLPPFHYMVAIAGGSRVRCAPYFLYGSPELADATLEALGDRRAVLLANHGLLTCGSTVVEAFEVAVEIESLCDSFLRAKAAGEPVLLTNPEMQEALARFSNYKP